MFGKFKKITVLGSMGLAVVLASFTLPNPYNNIKETAYISNDDALWTVFEKLGKIKINQVNTSIEGVSAEKGRDLIFTGSSTKQNGKGKTSNQSPYFKCTACHNMVKEFDDLSDISSQKRLDYAEKNNLPFLQGSSFYGVVNRTTFYNDDYQKKYGHVPIIKASNTDIRQAIQLCATQCSQGRALADWEIESVLAYFWTLELKINDLNLSEEEKTSIETSLKESKDLSRSVHLLEAKYLDKSPAHFAEDKPFEPMTDEMKNNITAFNNGKLIYDRSCLYCHQDQRYSFFELDNSKFSFVNLLNRTKKGSAGSLHKITRHGTWPLAGKRAYMPLYPTEKLSEDQLVDLRIYIENKATGK